MTQAGLFTTPGNDEAKKERMRKTQRNIIIGICFCAIIAWVVLMLIIFGEKKNTAGKNSKKSPDNVTSSEKTEVWVLSELYYNGEKALTFDADSRGRVSKATYIEEGIVYGFEYIYQDGEPITRVTRTDDTYKVVREYNSKGMLLREQTYFKYKDDPSYEQYFPDGKDYYALDEVFDENGRVIQSIEYLPDGSVEEERKSKYDPNGRRISYIIKRIKNGEETVVDIDLVELDSEGRLVRRYGTDGTLSEEITYFPDGHYVVIGYFSDGRKSHEIEYNTEGRISKHTMYSEENISRVLSYEYKATENGYMMTEKYEDFPDGPVRITETEYDLEGREIYRHEDVYTFSEYLVKDDQGRIIRREKRYDDGRITVESSIEYDEHGNRITKNEYGRSYEWKYNSIQITKAIAEENAKFFFDDELYLWSRGIY